MTNLVLSPFERLVLRALGILLRATLVGGHHNDDLVTEIELAIRTSDGQQRADEAQKGIVP